MALAQELDDLNHHRKSRQQQMQTEALEQLRALMADFEDEELPPGLCLFDESWHQGIVGLVASKIKDAVYRPVLAFAPESEGSDVLKGSARSVRGLHIRDVLARVDAMHPGMVMAFGGHAMAAGLTIGKDQLAGFKQALEESIEFFLNGDELSNDIFIDGSLDAGDINLSFAESLRDLGPWGQRFPEPLFEGRFVVEDKRVVGAAHLKMQLRSPGAYESIDAIAFGRLPEDLPGSETVGFIYKLDINHFRGQKTCQLMIEQILDED
jgi:single-stranded-DNA-specific exonuclease